MSSGLIFLTDDRTFIFMFNAKGVLLSYLFRRMVLGLLQLYPPQAHVYETFAFYQRGMRFAVLLCRLLGREKAHLEALPRLYRKRGFLVTVPLNVSESNR